MTTATTEKTVVGARQAGGCVKALYLAATGAEPSEPLDDSARNRMEAGLVMKDVVTKALERSGWELKRGAPTVQIDVGDRVAVRGLPDEIGRHEEYTQREWVIVQTGSAKESRFRRWMKETSLKAYPQRVHQLAMLIEGYDQFADPPEGLNLEEPQMVAVLNRDSGLLEYETLEREDLRPIYDDLIENMRDLDAALTSGEEPEAPFLRTSLRCRQCPFLTACHGKPERAKKSQEVTDLQVQAALATMEDLYDEVEAAKPANNKYEAARKVIRQHMVEKNLTDLRLEGESRVWNAHLERDARVNLNLEAARQRVSAAVMAEISSTSDVMSMKPE